MGEVRLMDLTDPAFLALIQAAAEFDGPTADDATITADTEAVTADGQES